MLDYIGMAKILVVEDDPQLALSITKWLSAEHHEPSHCDNGEVALERLQTEVFELAILDWELPGMTGVEICRRYRAAKGTLPVLMLTGRDSVADRITGLDVGADDYLTKPFSLKELCARVRALLRRPAQVLTNVLEVGSLKLDTVKHRISKNGHDIQLMPRDFALLEFFMKNPDMVFSAEALLARVWSDDTDAGSEALRTSIKRIRKKIDDTDSESASMLENIPRIGYRLRIVE